MSIKCREVSREKDELRAVDDTFGDVLAETDDNYQYTITNNAEYFTIERGEQG